MYRVHPDHVLAQLHCERPHQAHDTVLGGDVVAGVRMALMPTRPNW